MIRIVCALAFVAIGCGKSHHRAPSGKAAPGTATSGSTGTAAAPVAKPVAVKPPVAKPHAPQVPRPAAVTGAIVASSDKVVAKFEQICADVAAAKKDCAKAIAAMKRHAGDASAITQFAEKTLTNQAVRNWFHESYRMRLQVATAHIATTISSCGRDVAFGKAFAHFGWKLPF